LIANARAAPLLHGIGRPRHLAEGVPSSDSKKCGLGATSPFLYVLIGLI